MQGSETIIVVEALGEQETDWQGDPVPGADRPEREVDSCVLIPRTLPDDPTVVIDGYQVVITDTEQIPPTAEDSIKIRGTEKIWFIDGNVGDFTKPSGDLKAFIFVIKSVR